MRRELWKGKRIFVLLVVVLFFNLPFISALELSNVRVEEITDTSASVRWETDEPADSFVSYGEDKEELITKGDAKSVTKHSFGLDGLLSSKTYYFKVKSGGFEEDNEGEMYSFETLEADVTAPEIKVEVPSRVAGNKLDVEGSTETGVEVRIFVNEMKGGETTAEEGKFSFTEVSLLDNEWNTVLIEAEDKSGNIGKWEGEVFADTEKPRLELEKLQEITDKNEVLIKGKLSENCSIEILVNNRSMFKGEGNVLEKKVSLQEGENEIQIIAVDAAGWEVVEEFVVSSDTAPPQVRFEIEKGGEYYQGRAESDISGETEAGAAVYLYVYRRLGYEYTPKFDKAWMKVTADEEGKFTFKEVDFECKTCNLEKLKPKEVPAELLEVSVFPAEVMEDIQRWTYHIYVVAEDKTGKTGSAQRTINVNTCYTANWAFNVQSEAKFQAPLRLDSGLLDEGREVISAWFSFKYNGEGVPKTDLATGREIEPGFKIVGVRFEKACTQGMQEDDAFKIGCRILPGVPKVQPNGDKTAYFVTWNLHKAEELSETEDDFWNEFQKRMLMFPLKIMISYRERLGDTVLREGTGYGEGYESYGGWSDVKTQATCYDLGYFVDIPLDSQKMLPDWLVNEGVEGLEWTIDKLDKIKPIMDKAMMVAGFGCIFGWLLKMAVRWGRVFASKVETYYSWFKVSDEEKEKGCPPSKYGLYLKSTIEGWKKLEDERAESKGQEALKSENSFPPDYDKQEDGEYVNSLEKRCPNTASWWKLEANLDQFYRWTCDRFLCRKVPAAWTSTKEESEIKSVILKQQQCAVTAAGVPLLEVKDCQTIINKQPVAVFGKSDFAIKYQKNNPSYICYRNPENDLYIWDDSPAAQKDIPVKLKEKGGIRLHLIGAIGERMTRASLTSDLLAYQPPGSDQFMVARDMTCKDLCIDPRRPGYKADSYKTLFTIGGEKKVRGGGDENGCYTEEVDKNGDMVLLGEYDEKIKGDAYEAETPYTKDCFIDDKTGDLERCVCRADEEARKKYEKHEEGIWLRTAAKEADGAAEPWSYRQATIFRETGKRIGTYYPELRYYSGRDLSGAFGADYLLDYVTGEVKGTKDHHEINPSTQHIGAFQSLCLTQINARLVMLRNILQGLKDCLYEAKYTGLHDAGVCKTLFARSVCGLIYKAIAFFSTGCSPYSTSEVTKGGAFGDVGAVLKAGASSIPEVMQTSIDEVKEDYGNAKLNEFFATGVQGFAQSICMFAFGFDWPMGIDFIMDTAYAVSMKTGVYVLLANRELSTYNPKLGTAIYNYEVAATILPGCKIRNYKVYLKCVGVEDMGRPGVQCGKQGCDCMNLMSTGAEAGRIRQLEGGMGFELTQGQPKSVEIPSPQKVDNSPYRYDHVVVELQLDRFQDAEACFDEGYRDGKFYFPITDSSSLGDVVCQVQPMTGKYFCPELVEFFGKAGLAYLEEPYATCWNQRTQMWVDCKTPNLFLLKNNDEVKVRAHVVADGKGQCLKVSVMGKEKRNRPIPENLPGLQYAEFNLGPVDKTMLSGSISGNRLYKVQGQSDTGCPSSLLLEGEIFGATLPTGQYIFNYHAGTGTNNYQLTVPSNVQVDLSSGYGGAPNGLLTKGGSSDLSLRDINNAVFMNIGSFKVRNVLGGAQLGSTQNRCTYQVGGSSSTVLGSNYMDLPVRFDLLYPDETGGCYNALQPVKTAVGRSSFTASVRVQREEMASEEAMGMHNAFMNKEYTTVAAKAENILSRGENDLMDATAIYYYVAVDVMRWKEGDIEKTGFKEADFKNHIKHLLGLFFEKTYQDNVKTDPAFKKIKCYLCQVDKTVEMPEHAGACDNVCPS